MKNNYLKMFVLVAVLLTVVVGCGKKEEREDQPNLNDKPTEAEKKEYKRNCEIAAKKAYASYKTITNKPIIEGVCSNPSNSYIQIFFKLDEELLYQFRYDVEDGSIDYHETLSNTENHEQCKTQSEGNLSTVCANQNLMLSSYKTVLNLTDSVFSYQYMMIDVSKLK